MNANYNDYDDVNGNQMRGVSSITMLMRVLPSAGFLMCFLFRF